MTITEAYLNTVWGWSTFSDVDLPDGVSLSQSDGQDTDQVSMHFLLRVFLPAHH